MRVRDLSIFNYFENKKPSIVLGIFTTYFHSNIETIAEHIIKLIGVF